MTDGIGRPVAAILGGGFTGAAVAYHLAAALPPGAAEIVVIEPRGTLGAGLAYSTLEPAHRINVPAAKMSLDSSDPTAFARWLESSGLLEGDPAARTAAGDVFPQRNLFGRYVAAMLARPVADGRIRHVRARADTVLRRGDGRFEILVSHGPALSADIVVLATTHPLPAVPAALRAIAASPRFIADPYDAERLGRIGRDARVLVVGNGLTGADIVAALDRRRHQGPITSLSRHGLRSRGHARVPAPPFGDFACEPSATVVDLLRRIRGTIARAEGEGIGWHAVLDTVRNQGPAVWQALTQAERRRLVRHLRSFWDVHRFRIAPQVEAVLDRLTAAGRLHTVAASLRSAEDAGEALQVTFRRRHSPRIETGRFDAVVNTTGPAHRSVVEAAPVRSLFEAGLVRLDAVGLGLATTPDCRSFDRNGRRVPNLFIAGPLARGTVGELMGLLEVTRHAELAASEIAAAIGSMRPGPDGTTPLNATSLRSDVPTIPRRRTSGP